MIHIGFSTLHEMASSGQSGWCRVQLEIGEYTHLKTVEIPIQIDNSDTSDFGDDSDDNASTIQL